MDFSAAMRDTKIRNAAVFYRPCNFVLFLNELQVIESHLSRLTES
jgi:hypothetical protein